MPKSVDHERRREELAQAVWAVIRRDGVDGASIRAVAREAGCSPGALRHYFSSQVDMLGFAMRLMVARIERRIAALELDPDPRRRAESLIAELLPLDEERRAENEVWLAFAPQALADPGLRALHREVHAGLRGACRGSVGTLAAAGLLAPGTDRELEAERLHALRDGLALHTAMARGGMPPGRIREVLRRHLDTL